MLTFHQFTAAHVAQAARVYTTCFNAPPWEDNWAVEAASKRLETLLSFPNAVGVVAARSSHLVGLAIGHGEPWTDGLHFYLNELCIHPTEQRQGMGEALLNELMRELRARGVSSMFLFTEKSSLAESFFLEQGFEPDPSSLKLWRTV